MATDVVQVVEDERFRSHQGPEGHPERPDRLRAMQDAIDLFREGLTTVLPRPASADEILRVHRDSLFELLSQTKGQPSSRLDEDTYTNASSFDVACLAAGGSIDLVRAVMTGDATRGLAAIRPPGHHAESSRAMGFCLFNNVAIAARAAQAEFGTPRILIFDWDVHHGNGTQHSFEDDPEILYISTHQFPFYPGTGNFDEIGVGAAEGKTLNIPMPAGCGDDEYIGVMQRLIAPAAIDFQPDLILISCGFDAHRDDPLASMDVSIEGFRAMSTIMRALADDLCDGRIVYLLEGGYALSGVRDGARAVLESLVATEAPTRPAPSDLEPGTILNQLVDQVSAVHGRRVPGLGAAW